MHYYSKVKRVAILTAFNPETYQGGIETVILNLRSLLSERNISVDTHCIYPEPTLPVKPFPLNPLYKIIPEFISRCFMMGRAFSRIEKDYDFVITNNFYGSGYFSPHVKSFAIYHSTHAGYADALKDKVSKKDYRDLKYLYGHLGDRLSGRCKTKIAVSHGVKDELKKYYKFNDITVINHGVDTNFYKKLNEPITLRKKWDVPIDTFVGIFVGRWEIGKGTDIMEEVIKANQDITWALAIGTSDCPLTAYHNVRIVKDADRQTLKELYSLSDFMLFPSYYEGFGLVIIEAMACGLPVICTEVGIARELSKIQPLEGLILKDHKSSNIIKEIRDRIAFLKKSPLEKKEISYIGRATVEKNYCMDVWHKRMAATLNLTSIEKI